MKREAFLGTLAGKLGTLLFCLWLLCMVLLTWILAGDLQRQAQAVCADALEGALADFQREYSAGEAAKPEETLLRLPELDYHPARTLPLLRDQAMNVWSGSLTLNRQGISVISYGFDSGSIVPVGSVGVTPNTGVTVTEGRLAFRVSSALLEGAEPVDFFGGMTPTSKRYGGAPTSGFLTFRMSPLRKGSFPSAELSGSWPEERTYDPMRPLTPGNQTPPGLLDGIEAGEYHFDSHRLLQGTVLRGAWLRDGDGEEQCFVLAAYGWDPIPAAIKMLPGVYLASLLLFLLAGVLLWLALRRTFVRPLRALSSALAKDPLAVSEREYDFRSPYEEVQDVLAPYLLRRQMQEAKGRVPEAPEVPGPRLLEALDRAEGKLFPILMDRGQTLEKQYEADGPVLAAPASLEEALLVLFREAIAYAEQGRRMGLRTIAKEGFLLLEVQVHTKRRRARAGEAEFALLWEGIYRSPKDSDAPGAKLRRALEAIPGAFSAVRRTKGGLALTLGLPSERVESGV